MISIIITAYKEPETIQKAIECIINANYSGINEKFELIQVSPDDETLINGKNAWEKFNPSNGEFVQIKDPLKGKPFALNMAFKQAKGDILILTDGDVYFGPNAITHLIKPFENKEVGGVTGRPKSEDKKNYLMGYIGNLLADAAHHKRMVALKNLTSGKSNVFVSKSKFFPMSGYIMAIRNLKIELPDDVLADDAYISYHIHNLGLKLEYAPEAEVFVKYPKTLSDYFKQKKRSIGGYVQLWKYGVVKEKTKSRSFFIELQYFWFPFKYATNLKEFFWSVLFFPIRLWTWLAIFWERKILNKNFTQTWVRIETTKV